MQLMEITVGAFTSRDPADHSAEVYTASVSIGNHVVMTGLYGTSEKRRGTDQFVQNKSYALFKMEQKFIGRFVHLLQAGVTGDYKNEFC